MSMACEETKMRLHVSSWVITWPIALFPWQWKQIQLTLISVFSQTLYVWEKASLCPQSIKAWSLPLLNMLIHLVVPCSFSLPTRPPLPHFPFPSRGKGIGILQRRLGGPGLHPLVDYVWWREDGEGEVHDLILLTILVPYGERTGLSSGTVSGVAGPACLSNQGTFSLKLGISHSCGITWEEKTRIVLLVCRRDGSAAIWLQLNYTINHDQHFQWFPYKYRGF